MFGIFKEMDSCRESRDFWMNKCEELFELIDSPLFANQTVGSISECPRMQEIRNDVRNFVSKKALELLNQS
jgi:hypothetical protein